VYTFGFVKEKLRENAQDAAFFGQDGEFLAAYKRMVGELGDAIAEEANVSLHEACHLPDDHALGPKATEKLDGLLQWLHLETSKAA
jgi:hypothetical protein